MPLVADDLRYGMRLLRKAPGFTAVSLIALALGIGATTAIFSAVDAVLLKPLPFRDSDRLLAVWEKNPAQQKYRLFVAGANFMEWQRQSRIFEDMAALQDVRINLTGGPNGRIDPEELRAERVTANLFPLLGVAAALGRTFREDEDRPGRTDSVLLSHNLWTSRFGADAAIVGKPIRLQDRSYNVVGVLPAGFAVLDRNVDVWLPLGLNASDSREAAARTLTVIAHLKPGVSLEQARTEMEAIGERLANANPALDAGWAPSLVPLQEELVGPVRQPLLVLLGAVGFLLLMACVNVASLLLARGAGRRREIAVRIALGASRGRIVAQLVSESLLLSLAGGVLGIGLARVAMLLLTHFGPASIPRLTEVRLDLRLLLFTFGISIATGVLFGTVPALQISRANLQQALTGGGRGGTLGRPVRLARNGLMVFEIGLAVLVLIGAGLLIRSFVRLHAADPGFQAAGVLTARVPLAGGRNSALERRLAFFQQLSDRLAALPGVQAVGAVSQLPLTGFGMGAAFAVEGRPVAEAQRPIALVRAVSPSYFHTMGIRLEAGRQFTAADTAQSPMVVIVNRTLARRFWPGTAAGNQALGSRLLLANGRVGEIVGVVADVKQDRIEGEDWPVIYSPYAQLPHGTMSMVVRTAVPPLSMAAAIERAVHQLDPEQPVSDIRPLEAIVDQAVSGARFNAVVLGTFAIIAFVLAAVGIYGVTAYNVSERTQEIGLRMALGAQPDDVLKLVLGQGARLAVLGIAAGLAAAFGLTRLMAGMLYGVKTTDAYTFAFISLLLGAVAVFASYLPSRRAMSLDPVTALRHE